MWPKIAGAQALHEAFPPAQPRLLLPDRLGGHGVRYPGAGRLRGGQRLSRLPGPSTSPTRLPHRQPGLGGLAGTRVRLRRADRRARARTAGVAADHPGRSLRRLGARDRLRHRSSGDGADAVARRTLGPSDASATLARAWSQMAAENILQRTRSRAAEQSWPANFECRRPNSNWTGRSRSWASTR